MNERHQEILEEYADNMRFLLDELAVILDDRNSDQLREQSALELVDRPHLYACVCACREVFRAIANQRTDSELHSKHK